MIFVSNKGVVYEFMTIQFYTLKTLWPGTFPLMKTRTASFGKGAVLVYFWGGMILSQVFAFAKRLCSATLAYSGDRYFYASGASCRKPVAYFCRKQVVH